MMEAAESFGEVTKSFQIPKFSHYLTGSTVCKEISIDIDNFRSNWEVTVCPMCLDSSKLDVPVNCDVVIELKCIYSNAPQSTLRNITVNAIVQGREDYPKQIKPHSKDFCYWKDILISRSTLNTVQKLTEDSIFNFTLKFSVSNAVIAKSNDSFRNLSHDLEKVLKNADHFDTCLVTTSGSKFFTHSAILDARSNILEGKNQSTIIKSKELFEDNSYDPLATTVKCEDSSMNSSDASSSLFIGSPLRRRTPLFVVSMDSSPTTKKSRILPSPLKKTPSVTPKKKCVKESPCKGQMQLTNFFPRSSTLKPGIETQSSAFQKASYFSPIVDEQKRFQSPVKDFHMRSTFASPRSKENSSPRTIRDFMSPKEKIIQSPCGIKPISNFQSPKRKLSFESADQPNNDLRVININMSTSVTQELLLWIYTGCSSRLEEISRPLLVAALRYKVADLAEAAQHQLSSILKVENVSELLLLSHKYQAASLKSEAFKFAIERASEVTEKKEWSELSLRHPELMVEFTRALAIKT